MVRAFFARTGKRSSVLRKKRQKMNQAAGKTARAFFMNTNPAPPNTEQRKSAQ
jgi:hypothetical protein